MAAKFFVWTCLLLVTTSTGFQFSHYSSSIAKHRLHLGLRVCVGGIVTKRPTRPLESLRRSEKLFRKLEAHSNRHKALLLRTFVICGRLKGEEGRMNCVAAARGLSDWVPILQTCVLSDDTVTINVEFLSHLTTTFGREIFCALGLNIPSLKTAVVTQELEYAMEPLDSFEKYVYRAYLNGQKAKQKNDIDDNEMGKDDAFRILFNGEPYHKIDRSLIKKQFRHMSMLYHPDRTHQRDQPEEDTEKDIRRFQQIQAAYDVLHRVGMLSAESWFESLGGRERSQFTHVQINPKHIGVVAPGALRGHSIPGGWSQAIHSLNSEFVEFFVFRNRNAASGADMESHIF